MENRKALLVFCDVLPPPAGISYTSLVCDVLKVYVRLQIQFRLNCKRVSEG